MHLKYQWINKKVTLNFKPTGNRERDLKIILEANILIFTINDRLLFFFLIKVNQTEKKKTKEKKQRIPVKEKK